MFCQDNVVIAPSDNPRITKLAERSPKVCLANEQEVTKLRQSLRRIGNCERTVVGQITADQKQLADRFQRKLVRSQLLDSRMTNDSCVDRRPACSASVKSTRVGFENRVASAGWTPSRQERATSLCDGTYSEVVNANQAPRRQRCKTAGVSRRDNAVNGRLTQGPGCFSGFSQRRRDPGKTCFVSEGMGDDCLRPTTTVGGPSERNDACVIGKMPSKVGFVDDIQPSESDNLPMLLIPGGATDSSVSHIPEAHPVFLSGTDGSITGGIHDTDSTRHDEQSRNVVPSGVEGDYPEDGANASDDVTSPTKEPEDEVNDVGNSQGVHPRGVVLNPTSVTSSLTHRPTTATHTRIAAHVVMFPPSSDSATSEDLASCRPVTEGRRSYRRYTGERTTEVGRGSFLRTIVDSYDHARPVTSGNSGSRSCSPGAFQWPPPLLTYGVTSGGRSTAADHAATPASLRLKQLRVRSASYQSRVDDFCERLIPLRCNGATGADYYYLRLNESTPSFERPLVRWLTSPDSDYARERHIQGIRSLTFRPVDLIM